MREEFVRDPEYDSVLEEKKEKSNRILGNCEISWEYNPY